MNKERCSQINNFLILGLLNVIIKDFPKYQVLHWNQSNVISPRHECCDNKYQNHLIYV
jgi:hypothetical protein